MCSVFRILIYAAFDVSYNNMTNFSLESTNRKSTDLSVKSDDEVVESRSESSRLPELLSPCGSPEALDAAIEAGADAAYLGGNLFNARINAANFDDQAMLHAIETAHAHGVRIYVTLNTQLFDRELEDAVRYAAKLYDFGADALITADLGLAHLLRIYLPSMELHASTQMTAHNVEAANYLAEMGFSRMVCARETTLVDMQRLAHDSPIEIKNFIKNEHCV